MARRFGCLLAVMFINGLGLAQELRDPFASTAPKAVPPARQESAPVDAKPAAAPIALAIDSCVQAAHVKELLAEVAAVVPVAAQLDRGELGGELKESAERWARAAMLAADETIARLPALPPPPPEGAQTSVDGGAQANGGASSELQVADPRPIETTVPPGTLSEEVQRRVTTLEKHQTHLTHLCETQPKPKAPSAADTLNNEIKSLSDALRGGNGTQTKPAAPAASSDAEAAADRKLKDLKALQATLTRALAANTRSGSPVAEPTPTPQP